MMVACILVMLMLPAAESAGDDNNSNTVTIIIAVTATVVGIGIIVVVIIGCMYYSRSVTIIKARVKKQIINTTEKRHIYRPEKLSIDDYFKVYENEEKRTFFPDDKLDVISETAAASNETEKLKNELRKRTENEIHETEENLQMLQIKQLHQNEEMSELENVSESIYVARWEDTLDEEAIASFSRNSNDENEIKDDESIEDVPLEQVLIHSTDGKHKVLTNKLKSRGFLTVDHTSSSNKNQKRNYIRWKMLSLETKTKHGTAPINLKSATIRHKMHGYFRKSLKTKVTKLQNNKMTKNDRSKYKKAKAGSRVMGHNDLELDNEKSRTLKGDGNDKKDIQEETEYGHHTSKAVENGAQSVRRTVSNLSTHNNKKVSDSDQKLQDTAFKHITDSETETEKEDEAPEGKTDPAKRKRKNVYYRVKKVDLKTTSKIYLDTSDTIKTKESKLRINKTTKKDSQKNIKENSDKCVTETNTVNVDQNFVIDNEEPASLMADEYDKKDIQEETEYGNHISKAVENGAQSVRRTVSNSSTHTEKKVSDSDQKLQDTAFKHITDSKPETEKEEKAPEEKTKPTKRKRKDIYYHVKKPDFKTTSKIYLYTSNTMKMKTKVSKLRINKMTKNDSQKYIKENSGNCVTETSTVNVNQNFAIDNEEPESLMTDEYNKKDLNHDDNESYVYNTEYKPQINQAVESSKESVRQITAAVSDTYIAKWESETGKNQQDTVDTHVSDSETETEKEGEESIRQSTADVSRHFY